MLISVIKFLLKILFIFFPIIILIIYLLALILKIKLVIKYNFRKNINIFTFGIFLGKIKLKEITTDFNELKNKKHKKTRIKSIEDIKKHKYDLFPDILIYVFKIISVVKLESIDIISIKIDLGAGEAHYTSILSGCLYAVIGSLYAYINNNKEKVKKVNKQEFKINYFFNDLKFELSFDCIVRTKGANIIKVIFLIIKEKLKNKKMEGKNNERTSYPGAYDHSNAKY